MIPTTAPIAGTRANEAIFKLRNFTRAASISLRKLSLKAEPILFLLSPLFTPSPRSLPATIPDSAHAAQVTFDLLFESSGESAYYYICITYYCHTLSPPSSNDFQAGLGPAQMEADYPHQSLLSVYTPLWDAFAALGQESLVVLPINPSEGRCHHSYIACLYY